MFKNCHYIIDEESGPSLFTIVENHFKTIEQIKANQHPTHRPSLVSINKRNRIIQDILKDSHAIKRNNISFHTLAKVVMNTLNDYHTVQHHNLIHKEIVQVKESDEFKERIKRYEEKAMQLKPETENRIVRIQAAGC